MTSSCRLLTILTLASALALTACDKQKKPESTTDAGTTSATADAADATVAQSADAGPNIVYTEGPRPTDDTVIAEAGASKVTWVDYQHAVRLGRLFGPSTDDGLTEEVKPETLATPHLQSVMARSLLSRRIVTDEVKRRGITITDDEVKANLQADGRLERWAKYWDEPEKMKAELAKLGVSVDDFKRVGREQVAQEKLRDALVGEISADELWPAYQYENDTVRLVAIATLNVPSSDELDAFTENRSREIMEYFKKHEERYTYPARAEATIMAPSSGSTDRAIFDKVQAEIATEGADIDAIVAANDFVVKKRQLFTKTEDPKLFEAKLGDTGVTESARGTYVWRKTAQKPPTMRELTFGLKREIAATILRESGVTDEAKEKLEAADEVLRKAKIDFGDPDKAKLDALLQELRALDVEAKVTPDFPKAQNGFVPGFGIHPELAAAAFSATKKKPYPKDYIQSRDKAMTFRLIGRNTPKKKDFEKNKKTFAETYRMRAQQGIVDKFIQGQLAQHTPKFNLEPIRVVYGQIKKKR